MLEQMGGSGLFARRFSARIGSLLGLTILACGLVWLSTSVGVGATPPADGSDPQGASLRNDYIVALKDSVAHPAAVARAQVTAYGGRIGFIYRYAPIGYSATLSKGAVEALRNNPRVLHVTPDTPGESDAQTTPTGVKRVFALDNGSLGINEIEDITVESDIAILDTGIESAHPDLNVVQSFSCVPANEEEEGGGEETEEDKEIEEMEIEEEAECTEGGSTDPNGHGTHVAGIAAAVDNTIGVVGVAPGARLWSVRVINAQNRTTEARVTAGLNWVIAHASEIEVANLSLSCRPAVEATKCNWPNVETAINTAVENGVVVVLSAGNRAKNAENFSPAKNANAITVGAIADYDGIKGGTSTTPPCSLTHYETLWGAEKDDTWANLSNWGPVVDVVAPGVCIESTLRGKTYGKKTGTSMAAPAVSGAAAILAVSNNPENKADVEAIRTQIEEEGNFDWTAEKEGPQQPLLDVTNLLLPLVFCETDLGKGSSEGCPAGKSVIHVHETTLSEKKAKLLNKLINVECDVLLLGDVKGSGQNSITVEATHTYSNCNSGCTVKEEGGASTIKLAKTGHETAEETWTGEVHVSCTGLNCYYNGEGLVGTAKGPLLASEKNGEVSIAEQKLHKVKGLFCPSEAKLDIVTTPLAATYITN